MVSAIDVSKVELQVIERRDDNGQDILAVLRIRNLAVEPLDNRGWRLYFSFGLTVKSSETRVSTTIVDGRYGYLEPTPEWPSLATSESVELGLENWLFTGMNLRAKQGFHLSLIDPSKDEVLLGAPRLLDPVIVDLDRLENRWIETNSPSADVAPQTPENIYKRNLVLDELGSGFTVIPAVKRCVFSEGKFDLSVGLEVTCDKDLENERHALMQLVAKSSDTTHAPISVALRTIDSGESGSYHLVVGDDGILIESSDKAGVFYGIQTLRQLIDSNELRHVDIHDSADWSHRALFLDIARHFQDADTITKIIGMIASYKMNVLQLGISNDEGWRLEIPSIPELTAIGSRREFHVYDGQGKVRALYPAWGDDHEPYAGYLSRVDMIRILECAARNHVDVILEFNLPGHANAIIRSLENVEEFLVVDPDDRSEHRSAQGFFRNVVNVCMDSTYEFVQVVLKDMKRMYRSANVEFKAIHFGGDETPAGAWLGSAQCHRSEVWDSTWSLDNEDDVRAARRALMERHYRKITETAENVAPGIRIGFWHEMAPYARHDKRAACRYFNAWTTEKGQDSIVDELLASEQNLVISNASFLYLDMPYGLHKDEPGLPWASYIDTRMIYHFDPLATLGVPANKAHLVLGLQAQLWGETVYDHKLADFYLFPRTLAVAERAWNRQPTISHWGSFARAVGSREMRYMGEHGIEFRIPPPGARIEDGVMYANVAFPGLVIRYTLDGNESKIDDETYRGPVHIPPGTMVILRTVTDDGRASRSVRLQA